MQELEKAIERAQDYCLSRQSPEGFWVAELEADSTLTSEYLLLNRFVGRADPERERKAVNYLLRAQLPEGGWPIYHGGPSELSCSVKAYFALKLSGLSPDSPPMAKARETILSLGEAAKVNTFSRITLALFGQYPWEGIPAMPVELALLPTLFFHEVSYWSRTVIMPLLIIFAKRPLRPIPPDLGIRELWQTPQKERIQWFEPDHKWLSVRNAFLTLDGLLRGYDAHPIQAMREKALKKAETWILTRMSGSGGLGAIYPAMANSVFALVSLGYPPDHPKVAKALKEIDALIVEEEEKLHLQPCVSPVWDTANTIIALAESGLPADHPTLQRAAEWLIANQIRTVGDWAVKRPNLEPGGWAFQFENSFYPDCDDTAMVLIALSKVKLKGKGSAASRPSGDGELGSGLLKEEAIGRGLRWLIGMQSKNGGWGAYDADNTKLFLNEIPFADHKALLDPPTSDVTARAVEVLGHLGYGVSYPPVEMALRFLKREQEADGSWYGRWGVNYIYGTWSVLSALRAIGEDMRQPYVRKAVAWLKAKQNKDGGWGESCLSYEDPTTYAGVGTSTPSQTAWALLGLLAAGEVHSEAVDKGVKYLLDYQQADGSWPEEEFTGTGFPRVFYLRYHWYSIYFPLLALGRYRQSPSVAFQGEPPRCQERVS